MRTPLQLAIIFAICLAGEFLHRIVGIPLPGNIIGMVLLLILLCLKVLKPEQISGVSSFFLNHLALFFLPPSIAIMAVGDDVTADVETAIVAGDTERAASFLQEYDFFRFGIIEAAEDTLSRGADGQQAQRKNEVFFHVVSLCGFVLFGRKDTIFSELC
ncbi:MAG: CidA/LrgA family protein [Clostridia bacterium]|nr:CidA/LrgA family protein [Clostridia bacterium]